MAWVEKHGGARFVSTPCCMQGRIQPGLEFLLMAPTASLCNLLQCFTTLWVKNLLLQLGKD